MGALLEGTAAVGIIGVAVTMTAQPPESGYSRSQVELRTPSKNEYQEV